jgi:uncharacterized OsmC-like protein
MLGYPYEWLPVGLVVGTALLLTNAYLALIALAVLVPAALVALAAAIVLTPYALVRYAGRRWREPVATPTPRPLSTERQEAGSPMSAVFVIPTRRGDGLRASIRGHVLELADPNPGHGLAPTPDDLLIVAVASDLAWSARRFLRDQGLTDDVSVSAAWRTPENPPSLPDISVTVALPEAAETMSDALMTALEARVAARSLDNALRVYVQAGVRRETDARTREAGASGGTPPVGRP